MSSEAAPQAKKLKLVLCWHMHQPQYRDLISGTYYLPWTYLHAIKDYVDMAEILRATPEARAVVNFSPVLIEQVADYAAQLSNFFNESGAIRDPLLAALDEPALTVVPEERLALIKCCLRVNEQHFINRYPQYRELADIARWLDREPHTLKYLDEQYLVDIVVWYHLAWIGETIRREDERVQALIEKGDGFTLQDRRVLLALINELVGNVIGSYKSLAESGQIELSVTPYGHPIVPLLLDIGCASDAMPDVILPNLSHYPGGEKRARWHIEKGLETFENTFGFRPHGCWPSEGSVSEATLRLLGEYGFRWTASGENVFHNSVMQSTKKKKQDASQLSLYQPIRVPQGGDIACFFRDDGLSDLIGFTYSDWHSDDAVGDFIHHLEQIAAHYSGEQPPLVSVILDGENAWEYYPENGYHFLKSLYQRLAEHPHIEMTTFSDCLEQGAEAAVLDKLVAGSWVYGNFATWIGDADKNRGWDVLGEAKRAFDGSVSRGFFSERHSLELAEKQLAVCEGSDWCWWFGDYNPADSVSDFERLYRLHLSNLYHMIGVEPPEYLVHALSHGGGHALAGGTMRKGSENS